MNFTIDKVDNSASLLKIDESEDAKTPISSLLNKDNMKKLCDLGLTVPNIMKDENQTLGKTFNLTTEWDDLARILKVQDARHLYVLWLWLDSLKPSNEIMALSWRGSAALKHMMTDLRLQVPLMTLASEFA